MGHERGILGVLEEHVELRQNVLEQFASSILTFLPSRSVQILSDGYEPFVLLDVFRLRFIKEGFAGFLGALEQRPPMLFT